MSDSPVIPIKSSVSVDESPPAAPTMRYKRRPNRRVARKVPGTNNKALGTNDVFSLVHCSFVGAEARRWRDLIIFYYEKLGPRFFDEMVRIKVIAIVNLTLELERMTDACVAGSSGHLVNSSGPPHRRVLTYHTGDHEATITIINTITSLLKSIGIE